MGDLRLVNNINQNNSTGDLESEVKLPATMENSGQASDSRREAGTLGNRDVTMSRQQSTSSNPRRRTGSLTPAVGQPTLVFTDVCMTLGKTEILKTVNGLARAGQMLAVMGPSGAGKSTLLNTLTGRTYPTSGRVELNGHVVDRQVRRKISYVVQQDVFYPNLTLKETLVFTTMIRLPDDIPREEKLRRLKDTIDVLELNKCLNTKMGDSFITGLSGGEKKRASIACELVTNPNMLILDEPTTGLDAAIANHLMAMLDRYVKTTGKTVVTTIHQPSSQIFHMFSSLLLLSDGEVAYFGSINNVVNFFAAENLICAPHYNPADFILETLKNRDARDRLVRASLATRTISGHNVKSPAEVFTNSNFSTNSADSTFYEIPLSNLVLQTTSQNSVQLRKSADDKPDTSIDANDVDNMAADEDDLKWPTGFRTQYKVLTRRAFMLARNRLLSKLNFCQILAVALLNGLFYLQLARVEETAKDRLGALYCLIVYYSFVSMVDGINLVIDKTGVFHRERSAGLYRLSAYYLAMVTTEIPMTCILPTMYVTVIYWMVGLTPTAENFIFVWLIVLLNVFMSQGIGIMFGVLIGDDALSRTVATSFRVASFLAAGFYNSNIPSWFAWTKYISYMYYAYGLLCKLEFVNGAPIKCKEVGSQYPMYCTLPGNNTWNSTYDGYIPGDVVLTFNKLNGSSVAVDLAVLIALSFISRFIAYIILLHWRRPTA